MHKIASFQQVHDQTLTDFHAETHNQGGINIFAGKGFAAWHAVSPNDFEKVKKLHLSKNNVSLYVMNFAFLYGVENLI